MEKSQFAKNEEEVLKQWEDKDIFNKTLGKDSPKGNFIFFEGPPTANGRPGIHHILARAFKDVIPRFKTMQGFHVERKAGWDTHGLPVELQVEKALEISGKPQIEEYGVEEFNAQCKKSVWQFQEEWERLTKRIAFWLDLENPYVTYHNDYIESLWWILSQAENKKLLYKGHKVVPHCPRCGTALSSHEVAQGYKTVKDNSVYVKFKVKSEENTYVLSWTTTPWTLPGNVALAVGNDIEYVKVKVENEVYILAKPLLEDVLEGDYKVLETVQGKDLVGMEYEPLFEGAVDAGEKKAWYVTDADFVTIEDGTGVVHTAVMYGEDDYQLGVDKDLPFVHTVDEAGKFLPSVEKWAGKFVKSKKVEGEIIADLNERGLLLREKEYEHEYPFCWRCDSPLLYYAKDSWFIKMSAIKDDLVKNNQDINWVPAHIKDGRFGDWIGNVKDWAISRQRYWGTPIPIWQCQACEDYHVVGSYEELEKLSGGLPKDKDGKLDAHRPFVDDLKWPCKCGGEMTRVTDVFDCWFDSGAMPYAQHHYPFENKEMIDEGKQYPADYISEAIDQTRGWFYTLLAVSTILGKGTPYKNVICLGHIRDKDGKKMSKSKGNVIDPWMITDKYGVDALRMHLYSINQPGDPKNFDEKNVEEVLRKTVMLLGNVVNFYDMYSDANLQNTTNIANTTNLNVLDRWILVKLNLLVKEVTGDLEAYHVFESSRSIISFIDELSTWYVRRSRDRFKVEGEDKVQATATMKLVLETLVKVMAPFMPFTAERFYEKLGGSLDSVHLEVWPEVDEKMIKGDVIINMDKVRQYVELGFALRDEKKMKVRQPLSVFEYEGEKLDDNLEQIIAEELNVKEVNNVKKLNIDGEVLNRDNGSLKVSLNFEISEELRLEGHLRELVRNVNNMRKNADYQRGDEIVLYWESDSEELKKVLGNEELLGELKVGVTASDVKNEKNDDVKAMKEITINDQDIWVGVK